MKKLLLALIILIGVAVGVGIYFFNKKVPGLENTKADYEISADELFDAFNEDETEALRKYENKVIAVSGKVDRIKLDSGRANVILHAENAMAGGINCSFKEALKGIEKGDQVTIKGRCQGFLMDVILNNCYLEK
jgi:hypothetical protein